MSPYCIDRRSFIRHAALLALTGCVSCRSASQATRATGRRPGCIFFVSQGRTAVMNADGSGLRYFDFKVPNQATWQPGPFFADGRRVIFLSMEPRQDGPGRPFKEFYTQTPTHIWTTGTSSLTSRVAAQKFAA